MPRYKVSGIPPAAGARGTSAYFPHFNRLAASGAQEYKDGVVGLPGTRAIPVQTYNTVPSPDLGDIAQMGLSRSSDAPDAFWPNLYYVTPERNYRPGLLIQVYDPTRPQDTTVIPVPAVSLRQTYQRMSALMSGGIQNAGSSPKNVQQPVSQLISWAKRKTGNGIASG